ncbi:MAG: hypothetical protein WCG19_05270 [Chlorobiaceae bacterium]
MKYIGINQRIPYSVLDESLRELLYTGEIKRGEILEKMLQVTSGENRARKATMYVNHILSRPKKFLSFIEKSISTTGYEKLSEADRKAVILCLVVNTFPIAYDLLCAIATVFKVQECASRAFINQKMSALYGSNRTIAVAIDALMPMLIELGALERVKMGVYRVGSQPKIVHPAVAELYVAADIALSGSKSIAFDEINYRSWFFFNRVELPKTFKFKLLKMTEGMVGGGYVGIG